jgi:hypothetical protein
VCRVSGTHRRDHAGQMIDGILWKLLPAYRRTGASWRDLRERYAWETAQVRLRM